MEKGFENEIFSRRSGISGNFIKFSTPKGKKQPLFLGSV
jgi:hypothetical protein